MLFSKYIYKLFSLTDPHLVIHSDAGWVGGRRKIKHSSGVPNHMKVRNFVRNNREAILRELWG